MDDILLEALASQKYFQPNDPNDRQGNGSDTHWQKRSKVTCASVTDSDCPLYKKIPGDACRPAYLGHVVLDNRHGMIAVEQVTTADGMAGVDAAVQLTHELYRTERITLEGARLSSPSCSPQVQGVGKLRQYDSERRLRYEYSREKMDRVVL